MAARTRKPAPVERSLPEVVADGDHRLALEALRDELARRLPSAETREAPALARQLTMVLRELASLPSPATDSVLDDLASKRAARIAKAQGQ